MLSCGLSKWPRCAGSVRYGYRKMKRCRSAMRGDNEAWGTRSRGYPIGRLISGVGINAHRGIAETTRALEEERPSVETQGENEYERDR